LPAVALAKAGSPYPLTSTRFARSVQAYRLNILHLFTKKFWKQSKRPELVEGQLMHEFTY
jgi:hypothetical protein